MADEEKAAGRECLVCDIVWYAALVLAMGFAAFITYDTLSNGHGTELARQLFRKVKPALALVVPIQGEGEADSGSGGPGA